jgi:hypothetical protein
MARRRSEKNKKISQGIRNRIKGVCKKAQTFHRLYGGDAVVIVRAEGRDFTGYESRSGLLQEIRSLHGVELLSPEDLSTGKTTSDIIEHELCSYEGSSSSDTTSTYSFVSQGSPSIVSTPLPVTSNGRKRARLTPQQGKEILKMLARV